MPRDRASIGRVIAVLVLGLGSACPEEDEKSLPPLSGTGAGSLPGGGPDDAGNPPAATGSDTGTAGDTETDTGRGSSGSDTSAGSDTQGEGETIGATSLGEPPMVTTGMLTTG